MSEQPDPYACEVCGQVFAVPSLARDCEQSHFHPLRAKDVLPLIKKEIR